MSADQGFDDEIEKIKLKKMQELMRAPSTQKQEPKMLTLTDTNFEEALRTNRLLVVDFWAPWCAPCRMVSPIIEQLAAEFAGKVAFGKLNVDENPATAQAFGIQGIPTIMLFRDGQPFDMVVGAAPKAYYASRIRRLVEASAET